MNILVETNCSELLNMGDVAMLQIAVERLRQRWPKAAIRVITARPDLLARYCPTAEAVSARGRSEWFYSRNLFGKMHDIVPQNVDNALSELAGAIRRHNPRLLHGMLTLKARAHRRNTERMDSFVKALLEADLLAVSGGGDINDTFADFTLTLLEMVEMAHRRGTPVVMFGQGIGPLGEPLLRARAKAVLPHVAFIGVRERLSSVPLLESMDVPSSAIRVTGDDAVELAYKWRSNLPGAAVGINTRVSAYSMMDSESMGECRRVVNSFARKHNAPLVPVPISFYPQESDTDVAGALIDDKTHVAPPSPEMADPAAIINTVRQCRIVLTGSYHSAVFALAQGIPAVGIARSQYYRAKFLGLMDQFETECDVVSVDDDRFAEMLQSAAEKAWENSEQWRSGLLDAAERQIGAGKGLYDEVHRLVESRLAGNTGRVREYA